ncbi:MAG: SRPBCC family protein [Nocardioides sp.]|nr:SRPBCC family protein [Nocardioides sp.]
MHVERTFTVARPVETVFDYLSDFSHTEDWDPGTVETVRTAGDGGVGTSYRNTSQFRGRRVELTYETTVHQRPTELKFRGTNASATATDWLRFTRVSDDATRIHYRADFEFSLLIRLIAPLVIGRKLDALADETVDTLTRALLHQA